MLKVPKLVKEMTDQGLIHSIIDKLNNTTTVYPRLCRRNRDTLAHNDIYSLSMSLIEETLHLTGLKGVLIPGILEQPNKSPKKPTVIPSSTAAQAPLPSTAQVSAPAVPSSTLTTAQSVPAISCTYTSTTISSSTATTTLSSSNTATTAILTGGITNNNPTNAVVPAVTAPLKNAASKNVASKKQQNQQHPLIGSAEASIIEAVNAMRGMIENLATENKDLKSKIELLTTKVDQSGKVLHDMKSSMTTTNHNAIGTTTAPHSGGRPAYQQLQFVPLSQFPPPQSIMSPLNTNSPAFVYLYQKQTTQIMCPRHHTN